MDQLPDESIIGKTEQTNSPEKPSEQEEVEQNEECSGKEHEECEDEVGRQAECELDGEENINTRQSDKLNGGDDEREHVDTDQVHDRAASYEYCTEESPRLVAGSWCNQFTDHRENYFKGCKW